MDTWAGGHLGGDARRTGIGSHQARAPCALQAGPRGRAGSPAPQQRPASAAARSLLLPLSRSLEHGRAGGSAFRVLSDTLHGRAVSPRKERCLIGLLEASVWPLVGEDPRQPWAARWRLVVGRDSGPGKCLDLYLSVPACLLELQH